MKKQSTWSPTISIGDDDLDEIEMAPENMSTPARDARIAQERALAAKATAAASPFASGKMFSTRNLVIGGVVIAAAVYLYKRGG